jgi:uncharacterized protein YcbK (DUF882 family)
MKSKYFKIYELVPEHIYRHYKEKSWKFIDSRLIETIDKLKEHFNLGTMTINNYYWGKDRHWSGLRTPKSPDYSETSQHTFGRAADCVFSHYSAEEVRNYIVNNPHEFPYIKGLELGVSWVHLDVRNEDNLVTFKA